MGAGRAGLYHRHRSSRYAPQTFPKAVTIVSYIQSFYVPIIISVRPWKSTEQVFIGYHPPDIRSTWLGTCVAWGVVPSAALWTVIPERCTMMHLLHFQGTSVRCKSLVTSQLLGNLLQLFTVCSNVSVTVCRKGDVANDAALMEGVPCQPNASFAALVAQRQMMKYTRCRKYEPVH